MKTIYRVIEIVTKYKHNMCYPDEVYNEQYDLEDFKSQKSALKFLENKYKKFEKQNNAPTHVGEEARYTKLKEHTWKYQTVYDMYHSDDYQILNFVIVKLYID
jgi:hypothetical protein